MFENVDFPLEPLRGDRIAEEFQALVEAYVRERFGRGVSHG